MTKFAYFCGHEQWHPEQLIAHAQLAEEVGFDMVVVSEHFHPWVDDHGAAGFAFTTLGGIAATTSRIRMATGVTTPLFRYHPGVIAQFAATMDRISGGRFELGVGTGENINEGPLGYNFPPYAERAGRMDEALRIIQALLVGEKLSFTGRFYRTDRAKLFSPPSRKVGIWLAAGGPKSARLAAQRADGIITSVKDPAETKTRVVDPAQERAAELGVSPPQLLATRWSIFAEDRGQAWQAMLPWRGLRSPGRLKAVDPLDLRTRADQLPREEVLGRYSIVSNPDQIVETYRPLITELGADIVTLQMAGLEQENLIRLLGKEVLPRLRQLV